jgi:hypothetical protein
MRTQKAEHNTYVLVLQPWPNSSRDKNEKVEIFPYLFISGAMIAKFENLTCTYNLVVAYMVHVVCTSNFCTYGTNTVTCMCDLMCIEKA